MRSCKYVFQLHTHTHTYPLILSQILAGIGDILGQPHPLLHLSCRPEEEDAFVASIQVVTTRKRFRNLFPFHSFILYAITL